MNPRALHVRLVLWCTGVALLVSLAFGFYAYQDLKARLYDEMAQTLERRARQIRDNILPKRETLPNADFQHLIDTAYTPREIGRFIRITQRNGWVVYGSGRPNDGAFDPTTIPPPSFAQGVATKHEYLPNGRELFVVTLLAGNGANTEAIESGMLTDAAHLALDNLRITLLLGLPFVVLVASTGGYLLVRHALAPVGNIRAAAAQITFGNLKQRLPVPATGDALEQLSITLNQMLARLEDAYQQASRFSADAAHELRTPLTILRSEIETIMLEPSLLPHLRDQVGSVLEETERLVGIVEGLLAMSRLDAGEARTLNESIDLSEMVRDTAEQIMLLAQEKGIEVDIQAKPGVIVQGDRSRLKQMVVNLLDNAIKYTPREGHIKLRVQTSHDEAILEVADNGFGISADALPYVFDRFYRAEQVRIQGIEGAGLGLAIVRSICLAHRGQVHIDSIENQGTICRVTLPLIAARLAS